MKVLYFDCFSGISGDMILGALLDLGVDQELFRNELNKLNVHGYRLNIEKKTKNGIAGTDVQVVLTEENGHFARNLKNIEDMIDESGLKQSVKELSKKVFREIARAEAKVHNTDVYKIHFHEVGAVDSIVDVVGMAICIDLLDVRRIFSSALHDGCGFVETCHGTLPVPVPAVMEIIADARIPLISESINTELVTPTGAGIIKCVAHDFGNMPAMIIDAIGYGFGKKEIGRLNALRVVMGSLLDEENTTEEISLLETNIDDITPEILGFTAEKLLKSGALDVFFTPIYMKKNRPAYMLTALSAKGHEERLVDIILKETSTLGIRKSTVKRYCLDRKLMKVETEYGEVRVKVAAGADFKKASPEYEDCREIALSTGLPLRVVYEMVSEKINSAS